MHFHVVFLFCIVPVKDFICLPIIFIKGHLDRCVAGSVAYDILESCCEETSNPTAAVREYRHKFRLQSSLSAMRHQLPLEFNTPAIVKKVKKKITQVSSNVKTLPQQQGKTNYSVAS